MFKNNEQERATDDFYNSLFRPLNGKNHNGAFVCALANENGVFMSDSYNDLMSAFCRKFEQQFEAAYQNSSKRNRAKLLPYVTTIFRRWYYSALIENTYLTPANLVEVINIYHDRQQGISLSVRSTSFKKYSGMSYSMIENTCDEHPVVKDFREFIAYCQPDIEMMPDDTLTAEYNEEVSKYLSIWDPHYANYLLSIAMSMGLIAKIPSINANRAQVVKAAERRLSTTDNELFEQIVNAAVRVCVSSINKILPLPIPLMNERFVFSILKEPVETDTVFQRLYGAMGVDIEDIMDRANDDTWEMPSGFDIAVMSGTYLLGILLDKYFLTPFSQYLGLIRPLYVVPFDFESELDFFLDSRDDEEELSTAFFAPCSQYFLTEKGMEYLKIKPTTQSFLDVRRIFPATAVTELLQKIFISQTEDELAKNLSEFEIPLEESLPAARIYTLKVKSKSDPRMWLNIEAPETVVLHRLFMEMALYFDFGFEYEYTFFADVTENPFMAYVSPNQTRRAKQAAAVTLMELEPVEKQVMILSVNSTPGVKKNPHIEKWSIEVMKKEEGDSRRSLFPVVTRIGKALREQMELDDF